MRSSSGAYYSGLDHVRAVAAYLVVVWHFSHWTKGTPVPFNQAPELGILDEGHVGVAVFMTLSGYLFAKLIGDRDIRYLPFLWNRFLRLAPLMTLVLLANGYLYDWSWRDFAYTVSRGLIMPYLPNGGWSITVEAHFYLLLPLLLWACRKRKGAVVALVGAAVAVRLMLFALGFDIRHLANETIIGRFDQFAIGAATFYFGRRISGRHAGLALAALWAGYAAFDHWGGIYGFPYSALWLVLPTFEAACLATMIAWYDRHPLERGMWIVRKAGEYSYSIYLLHFFVVQESAQFVNDHVMRLPTLYHALPWATLLFFGIAAVGHVSWIMVERPFLRFRRPYTVQRQPDETQGRGRPD